MSEIDIEVRDDNNSDNGKSNEIDLIAIAKKLWGNRKRIIIWSVCGAVIGLIVAFSIPREYTTNVKLVPESGDSPSGNALGGLAAMAGINLGADGEDALSPNLYPDVISSVPFELSLLEIPLTDQSGNKKFTLEQYITEDVRSPWWSAVMSAPGAILSLFKSDNAEKTSDATGDDNGPLRITKWQAGMISFLRAAVVSDVDNKTGVISISVTMQDPVVSATLADTVAHRLQEFITGYRTKKARQDLEFVEKLNSEAKAKYYEAQQKYANYLDSHQGLVLYSAQTMRDRLENEATLAFNVYNQTAQKLELAKAKVQEQTPVYATIEPPTVPIIPSKPRKFLLLFGFTFLGFAACCAWIIFGQPLIDAFRKDDSGENGDSTTDKE